MSTKEQMSFKKLVLKVFHLLSKVAHCQTPAVRVESDWKIDQLLQHLAWSLRRILLQCFFLFFLLVPVQAVYCPPTHLVNPMVKLDHTKDTFKWQSTRHISKSDKATSPDYSVHHLTWVPACETQDMYPRLEKHFQLHFPNVKYGFIDLKTV